MSTHPGRNDPCSCGSGKKYKKCCGLREQAQTQVRAKYRALGPMAALANPSAGTFATDFFKTMKVTQFKASSEKTALDRMKEKSQTSIKAVEGKE